MSLFDFFKKKKTPENPAAETVANAPQMLHVRFLFDEKISLDKARVAAELAKEFASVEEAENQGNTLLYFFPDYTVHYQDGHAPAQCAVMVANEPVFDGRGVTTALTQSWHWPEAAAVIEKCRYEFLVTDMMSRGLEHHRRVEYFQKFVSALIKATKPQAVYFGSSDKLVEPSAYVRAVSAQDPDVLNGLVNARFFNVANGSDGEMFADTLGLHALGLPDFQIRFRGFDPDEVIGKLWGCANYIFQHGAVIQSGNTIQGLAPTDKWTCYYDEAAVEPKRIVVDIETR